MGRTVIGVLLSGLIMPGLGQIYQRRMGKGALLITWMSLLLIGLSISAFFSLGQAIVAAGEDPSGGQVAAQLRADPPVLVMVIAGLMAATWVYAVVDAARRPGPAGGDGKEAER